MTARVADSVGHDNEWLDIEALFPADPELMVSPEGDRRGLADLRSRAQARREQLAR